MSNRISRRDFIKLVSVGAGSVVLTSGGLLIPGSHVEAQEGTLLGTFPPDFHRHTTHCTCRHSP